MKFCNMVSVSGGKDSTATLLVALERAVPNLFPVFADTGNEHQQTYDYLAYLEARLGISIERVKADFSPQIERKRTLTMEKWERDGVPDETIERVKRILQPSGNPFLDLCLWKGRFPSSQAQFCTEELKVLPITEFVVWPLLRRARYLVSWQGIRRDESRRRSNYPLSEPIEPDASRVYAYRPLIHWSPGDVFAMHRRHDVKWNPLYEQGMGRVGCMPCIHAKKDELREIAHRFPEEVDRIREWEQLVSEVSKRQSCTFFPAVNDSTVQADDEVHYSTHGIDRMVDWANTARGGRQRDLLATDAEPSRCRSVYGLCE